MSAVVTESTRKGRKVRVLFINDTARNGGPGRSLFYILRFLDPNVVHRAVVLPREGIISELYASRGVTEELLFERDLVENPIEPWDRPMAREDFDAPMPLQGVRAAANVVRAGRAPTIRATGRCPACGGDKAVHVPRVMEEAYGNPKPLSLTGDERWSGRKPIAPFEVYACAACGFVEWYVSSFEGVEIDGKVVLDASAKTPEGGPYR